MTKIITAARYKDISNSPLIYEFLMGCSRSSYSKGDKVKVKGSILFEKTEKGWKGKMIDAIESIEVVKK